MAETTQHIFEVRCTLSHRTVPRLNGPCNMKMIMEGAAYHIAVPQRLVLVQNPDPQHALLAAIRMLMPQACTTQASACDADCAQLPSSQATGWGQSPTVMVCPDSIHTNAAAPPQQPPKSRRASHPTLLHNTQNDKERVLNFLKHTTSNVFLLHV